MNIIKLTAAVLAGVTAWQLFPGESFYSTPSFYLFQAPAAVLYSLTWQLRFFLFAADPPAVQKTIAERSTTARKVAIVTGSNTGIGYETARSLAVNHGMHVILACRTPQKANAAVDKIAKEGGKALFLTSLDLTDSQSIQNFVEAVYERFDRIDVLVNNAGTNSNPSPTSGRTRDVLFAANFLGHFELTVRLLPLLQGAKRTGAPARIVNLSSVMHHKNKLTEGDFDQVSFWEKVIHRNSKLQDDTYSISKLAAIFFTIQLRQLYPQVISIAVSPGTVNSDIWRNFPPWILPLFRMVFLSNSQGCSTSVAAATHADFGKSDDTSNLPLYLQPYVNNGATAASIIIPPWKELMGPYVGFSVTRPRLPTKDGGIGAGEALWQACKDATQVDGH